MMATPAMANRPMVARRCNATIQWNETVAMAAERMRVARCDSLLVLSGADPLGTISRKDVERCESQGNWLDSVLVVDVARRQGQTVG